MSSAGKSRVDKRPLDINLNTFRVSIGNIVIDKVTTKKFKIINAGLYKTTIEFDEKVIKGTHVSFSQTKINKLQPKGIQVIVITFNAKDALIGPHEIHIPMTV